MELSLNGHWKVTHLSCTEDISPLLDPSFVPEGWLTAQVPEDIHRTLRREGAIRGNTYDKRENEEQWMEERDWVYYKEFFVPAAFEGQKPELCLDGLDTFCDLYLNGCKIGSHRNMHVPYSMDVAPQLRCGQRNVLLLRFHSPVAAVQGRDERNLFSITTSDRIFARKAQMNYSWDFCARCLTLGIWKDVSIRCRNEARVDHYYLYTHRIAADTATLGLEVHLCHVQEGPYTLAATLCQGAEEVFHVEGCPEDFRSLTLSIPHPILWWPRPYGQPFLYDFTLQLLKDGRVIDEKRQQVGIRTVEVLQEPQPDGQSFQFAVNGKKLFIRGANWVPLNTVYTDITRQDYEEVLHDAVHGNLSMLRVWGGGIYESPAFFELCDRYGILVWNDFMLSCGIYPQDEDFLNQMAQEADYVLKAYRNYTCLAIWAGDNENGQAYGWANRNYEFEDDKISQVVLKEACQRLDPHRFFLPTSPGSPNPNIRGGDNPESPYQGDVHLYLMSANPGVTAYRDYGKDYYKRVLGYRPRFMSEFGFVSLPEKDSFYRFNVRRQPLRAPEEIIKYLPLVQEYLQREDFDAVIYYSQVFNAMALKYWIEYFRSLKGTCSGTLYWKFNDPLADCPDDYTYPSHMCAIDMYHKPKMTYYYTRRAYEDMLVCLIECKDGGLDVYACWEGDEDLTGNLCITRRTFDGAILSHRALNCRVPGDASTCLCHLEPDFVRPDRPMSEYLKATLSCGDQVWENRYFYADLCEIDQLDLPDAGLTVAQCVLADTRLTLRLQAERYARHIRLNLLDRRADYSDNYFDLDAGGSMVATIDLPSCEGLMDTVLYLEGENVPRMVVPLAPLMME